jgi:predicted GNAT family acetyltransferase
VTDAQAAEPADSPTPIVDNEAARRFELRMDGHLAELVYRRRPDRMVIVHTGVPPELEGHGIGGKLVQHALDDARARGLAVTLMCPFAKDWVEHHPEAIEGLTVDRR